MFRLARHRTRRHISSSFSTSLRGNALVCLCLHFIDIFPLFHPRTLPRSLCLRFRFRGALTFVLSPTGSHFISLHFFFHHSAVSFILPSCLFMRVQCLCVHVCRWVLWKYGSFSCIFLCHISISWRSLCTISHPFFERWLACTKKVGYVCDNRGLKTLDKVSSAQLLHILFSFTRPQRECTALIYRPCVTVTVNYSPYSL